MFQLIWTYFDTNDKAANFRRPHQPDWLEYFFKSGYCVLT